jgi:hypothetical protein
MEDKHEDSYSLHELFASLLSYITYLRRKWLTMVLIISVTIGAGIMYYFIQQPKYEASCTFIVEEKQTGLGSLSGLASQFGFDFGGNSGGSLFAGDNILEILRSKTIIRTVLLSGIDSNSGKKLIDQFIELKGWNKEWNDNPRLKGINFSNAGTGTQRLSLQQDSVLGVAHKALVEKHIIVERMIKKGSLVRVSVISSNEIFSKLMAERIVQNAKNMYVQIKTSTASTNVRRLENKADSLLVLLNVKSYQTAGSIIVDGNPGLRTSAVPAELNMRDKMVLQTLYAEIVKNLEISRTALMQQTPVIQVIDAPEFPLVRKTKSLALLAAIAIIAGFVLANVYLLIKFSLGKENIKHV